MIEPGANTTDALSREAKVGGGKIATTMTSRVDWYNLLMLFISTVAISGMVSLYVLFVAWFNLKNTDSDPLERAAMAAASDLLKINIGSQNFGTLGIADFVNSDNGSQSAVEDADSSVRSFNTVASLIRTSLFLAQHYRLDPLGERAAGDLEDLEHLQKELHSRFLAAIKSDGSGKIYEHVKRILSSSTRGGEHLDSLRIKLGFARKQLLISTVFAEANDDPSYTVRGRLKTLTPLAVPLTKSQIILHQQSDQIAIVNSGDFEEDTKSAALPTTLLIEADFATKNDHRGLVTSHRKVCVIAGASVKKQTTDLSRQDRQDGCLAITFPQGKPSYFSSLESILLYDQWQGKGEWQQAVQGTVPGSGQLAPSAAPVLKDMNPSESLSIAIYHWLRQLSHPVTPLQLSRVLKQSWLIPPSPKSSTKEVATISDKEEQIADTLIEDNAASLQVNSGLLKDSDARTFALLYQNKTGEAGQKALFQCFQALPNRFAPSTLPVVVDSEGRANLPGRQGFDQNLAFELLDSIYRSNVAAQDTLATGKLIQSSALRSYRSNREKLFLAQTDLDSLSNRLRLSIDKKERESLSKEIDLRKNRIAYEQNEQKTQLKAISLAQVALNNSSVAAAQSFACGSKLFQLARGGINRINNLQTSAGGGENKKTKKAYLLGKRYIFCPLTESLKEEDIFSEAAKAFNSGSTKIEQLQSPWLNQKTNIFGPIKSFTDLPDTKFMVENRSLSDLKAETTPVFKAEPAVIVFTPHQLDDSAKADPLYFRIYPFKGLAIPENQLIYYCQNAYRSMILPQARAGVVAWSVLARDFVFKRGSSSSHQKLGLPLQTTMTGWCKRALNLSDTDGQVSDNGDKNDSAFCPGLAAEWQLRSPVMLLNNSEVESLKGTTLSDPESGQRVLQIPPVSPDLM